MTGVRAHTPASGVPGGASVERIWQEESNAQLCVETEAHLVLAQSPGLAADEFHGRTAAMACPSLTSPGLRALLPQPMSLIPWGAAQKRHHNCTHAVRFGAPWVETRPDAPPQAR